MDHAIADVGPDHDQLEKIGGSVWPHHEVARRIVSELDLHDGLPVGMIDVFVGDAVPAG